MSDAIDAKIEKNEAYLRNRLKNCDDCIIRPMVLGEESRIRCLVVYIEVAVSNMILEDSMVGKLVNHLGEMSPTDILEAVRRDGLGISDVKTLENMEDTMAAMMAGIGVFFFDG